MIRYMGKLFCTGMLVLATARGYACQVDTDKTDDGSATKPAATTVDQPSGEQGDTTVAAPRPSSSFGVSAKEPVTTRWKIGTKIVTGNGRVSNLLVTFPMPGEWPEQSVVIQEESIPADIGQVKPRTLDSGVQQVVVQSPVVNANQELEISYIVEVRNQAIIPPDETQFFVLPRAADREVKPFLGASKNVNHKNSKLRKQAKLIVVDHETPWDRASAIYDWVRENIEIEPTQYHSATHTLKNKSGTNEDKTFLFVALCRAVKIPSRIVFAKGLAYAEFMLQDPNDEKLHWFPCNVTGIREFGGLSEPRIILQKGDGIRVPEKKEPQKYVAEFVKCDGRVRPRVGFFRAEIFDAPDQ